MSYISYLPTNDNHQWELATQFQNITNELVEILPARPDPFCGYDLEGAKRYFLETLDNIERLFFLPEEVAFTNRNTVWSAPNFTIDDFKSEINTPSATNGLVMYIAPKTRWEEIPDMQEMELVERELKGTSNVFIKVFTHNKGKSRIYVFISKQPTWEQLIKIKILQWSLFKDNIEHPEPAYLDILNGFLNNNLETINKAFKTIFERQDLTEYKYAAVKKAFEYGSSRQVRILQNRIEELQSEINRYENYLCELLTEVRHKNTMLSAAKNIPSEDMQIIIKYLSKHPYIKSFKAVNDYTVEFNFEAPIIYYDKYILNKIKERRIGTDWSILNIFDNDKYELITRCKIRFNTDSFEVSLESIGDDWPYIIGHPHIDRFGCFGNHNFAIQDAAKEGNYLGAIEQIVQAVLNLNFSDTYVVDTLINHLNCNREMRTWRTKETGIMLTTQEVLDNEETETDS